MIVAQITDFREAARRRLPRFLFEYIDGGSYAEVTLRKNVQELAEIALRQRVLRDVSDLDLSTRLFGQDLSLPVVLAPIGLAGMNARRGDARQKRLAFPSRFRPCRPVRWAKWRQRPASRSGFSFT